MAKRALRASFAVALAAAVLPGAVAHAAKPGSFAGSLGVKVPKGAQAGVRAVNRATGTVAAVRSVGRKGSFSLSLPAGEYLVIGTVVTARGKLLQKRIGISLRPGQKRKRTKLTARRRKRRKARSAFVQEKGNITPGRIAVEIADFVGSTGDPEWDAARRGFNDLMINDVLTARQDCGTAIIEVDRRAELIAELEFQQSPYVDPATRVTRNFIIGDVEVRGKIASAPGGNMKVRVTTVDKRTGKTFGSREATIDKAQWPDELEALAKQVADDLCKLSDVYEVTLDVAGEGQFATHSATGAIHTTLRAVRADAGRPVWRATGPLQWSDVTFASKIADCPMIDPVTPVISWSATILDVGGGELQVTWLRDGNDGATASIDCRPTSPGEPDPPPVPGMPGPALLTTGPESFVVPYAGGTQALSGIVADGGDGFFNTGSITVTPGGVDG